MQSAHQDVKLFVGNLPYFCTELTLFEAFQQFGKVIKIRMLRRAKSEPAQFAFVYMPMKDATVAKMNLTSTILQGRKIIVNWESRMNSTNFHGRPIDTSVSVHFKFETVSACCKLQVQDVIVHEDFVRQYFANFGHVDDVILKKSAINDDVRKFEILHAKYILNLMHMCSYAGSGTWLWLCSL